MEDQKKGSDATQKTGGGGSSNPPQQQQQQQQQSPTSGPPPPQQQQPPQQQSQQQQAQEPQASSSLGGGGSFNLPGWPSTGYGSKLDPAHVYPRNFREGGESGFDVNIRSGVSLENSPPPDVTTDSAAALNALILSCTESSRFEFYEEFIEDVFCSPEPDQPVFNTNPGLFRTPIQGPSRPPDADSPTIEMLRRAASSPAFAFSNRAAYELLKLATEAYLTIQCTDYDIDASPPDALPGFRGTVLARANTEEEIRAALADYLGPNRVLPYIDRIAGALVRRAARAEQRNSFSSRSAGLSSKASLCRTSPLSKFKPCCIELIWSYWHEEGMLVQTINAISLRFQNRRSGASGRDPLSHLELEPLRPLNNILWGYIQDEQNRLTIARRAYEYQHEYGLSLYGKAVPPLNPADVRSKFVEAFHNLLHVASTYFRDQSNRFVVPDSFPLLNAIKEVHLILAEGAHNQFGDLPWTARAEMLMQKWLLSRPEMERFLGGRAMIPYPEKWMGVVDQMKTLQGWSDVSVRHFRDLAHWGEQLLLSLRWNNWSEISSTLSAENWALIWRDAIQGYIHSYRAVTGVDLAASTNAVRLSAESYTQPSVLLRNRLAAQRRP